MKKVAKLITTWESTGGETLADFRRVIKSLIERVEELQEEIIDLRERLSHKKNL